MRYLSLLAIIGLTLSFNACTKKKADGPSKSSYEELEAMSAKFKKDATDLQAPITMVDSIIDQFTKLPTALKLTPEQFKEALTSAIAGDVKLPEGAGADAKTKMNQFANDLVKFKESLFATPDNIKNLVPKIAAALVQVPVLTAKIKAESTVTQANPFASKKDRAKAKKESAGADKLSKSVIEDIKKVQSTVTTLPAKATSSIQKFTAALAKAGITNMASLTSGAKGAATDKMKATTKEVKKATKNVAKDATK